MHWKKTKLNLNTNKNEAANRGLSASLPKNVTLSRNCTAQAYTAMYRMNYGIGASLLRKLEQSNCTADLDASRHTEMPSRDNVILTYIRKGNWTWHRGYPM